MYQSAERSACGALGLLGSSQPPEAALAIIGGWAQTSSAAVLCALPIAVWEFSLGVYLTVKGFKTARPVAGA